MSHYNLRRPSLSRPYTAEEQQELNRLLGVSDSEDDNDDSESDTSEYNNDENESIFDEADTNFAIDVVELAELNRSFEEDEPGDNEDVEEEEVDVNSANRQNKKCRRQDNCRM